MNLIDYLRLFHQLDEEQFHLLSECFRPKTGKKGELLVKVGEVQHDLLFVTEGVQMSFFEGTKRQHVIAFTYPPNLSAIPESFLFQKPSPYALQCITDSSFYAISYDKLQLLFDQSLQLERLFRKMTEAMLAGLITRHVESHALSIEERFKSFSSRSPHLFQLVPHKYIASYLNIEQTNFSKLYNSIKI